MRQSQIYNAIMNHSKLKEVLFPLIKEVHSKECLDVISIERKEFNGFPYVVVYEEYNKNRHYQYIARYMSTCMNLSSLCLEAEEYFFPFICLPENHPILTKKHLIENIEATIAHEVCHVKTILNYVDENPNYYKELIEYGFNNIQDSEHLEKSMVFEINKRLIIEPPALKIEYELGNRIIFIPLLFFVKELFCESVDEFIKINLFGELNELIEVYKEKFPNNKDEIDAIFEKILNSVSNEYLNENAFSEVTNIHKFVFKKLGVPGFD